VKEIISSVEFWKFVIPLAGAVVAWFVNEWRKRVADQYLHKEANYKELIRALRGFYEGTANADELKLEFLNQFNISWLYCPDDIIQKGYAFLETVDTTHTASSNKKDIAFGNLVVAIRKDLLSRSLVRTTQLSAKDFRHLTVKKQQDSKLN